MNPVPSWINRNAKTHLDAVDILYIDKYILTNITSTRAGGTLCVVR